MELFKNLGLIIILCGLTIPTTLASALPLTSIQISVDSSYPADYLRVAYFEEFDLRSNFEKVAVVENNVVPILPASVKLNLLLSWYSSMEKDRQISKRIFLFPDDLLTLEINKNESGYFESNVEGSNAEGHEQFFRFQEFVPAVYFHEMNQIPYSDAVKYTDELIGYIESHTQPFVNLLNNNQINSAYYLMSTDHIHSIFCTSIVSGLFRSRERIGSGIELAERLRIADKIIQHFNFEISDSNGF